MVRAKQTRCTCLLCVAMRLLTDMLPSVCAFGIAVPVVSQLPHMFSPIIPRRRRPSMSSAPVRLRPSCRQHAPNMCTSSSKRGVGDTVEGVVSRVESYGAFVDVPTLSASGLVHISQITTRFVARVEDCVKIGETVSVKVLDIDERGRLSLSLKDAEVDGYALVARLGGDPGHPWNDDGKTRWANLGTRSAKTNYPWEADPALFTFDHTQLPPPLPPHPPFPNQ